MSKEVVEFNLSKISKTTSPEPYGIASSFGQDSGSEKQRELNEMKMSKAKDLIVSKGKEIFTTVLSTFFFGNNLSLFTIFMFGYYISNCLKGIFQVNNAFKMVESPEYSLLPHKVIYVLLGLVCFSIYMYKVYRMGLIPLNPDDWSSFVDTSIPTSNIIGLQ